MEDLIDEALGHTGAVTQKIEAGRYDLTDSEGQIILPSTWTNIIKPGASLSMHWMMNGWSSAQAPQLPPPAMRAPLLPRPFPGPPPPTHSGIPAVPHMRMGQPPAQAAHPGRHHGGFRPAPMPSHAPPPPPSGRAPMPQDGDSEDSEDIDKELGLDSLESARQIASKDM